MKHYRPFIFIGTLIFCLFSRPFSVYAGTQGNDSLRYENYNIVLIYIDTLRADHLNCYGYFRKTSPNIDKVAAESIVFMRNYTPITYTLASFMSIITSLYPKSHGVLEACKDKIPQGVKTLAQILHVYGYKTAWFGPNHDAHLDPAVGFGLGFDEVRISNHSRENPKTQSRELCDWLEANKNTKFFLNFHTYKVHDPYFSSVAYKDEFSRSKQKSIPLSQKELDQAVFEAAKRGISEKETWLTEIVGRDLLNKAIATGVLEGEFSSYKFKSLRAFFERNKQELKMAQLEHYVYWSKINLKDGQTKKYVEALYDAAILEFDSEVIGPVVAKLKQLNLYEKSVIVICSDHGEEFFEHGGYGHGTTLYEELTHVPLIIKIPWIKRGRRIYELVQTTDIMPTILDLLDMVVPAQAEGKSLAGVINNKEFMPVHQYVFGQRLGNSSIRSEKWDLIVSDKKESELYHIPSDPYQQHNLYLRKKSVSAKLNTELNNWEKSLKRYQDKEYSFPEEFDQKTRDNIRKTGYC